jgi:dephospho-CoA kinase
MKLIGISGTNGSGKDTIGHMLSERHKYLFVSVTDMLRDEARKRELPVEREHLRNISAEWRREGGLGVLVDKAVEIFNQHKNEYEGLAIASLRNPGEVDRVHEFGGIVVWTDAEARVRYDRIQANAFNRGRATEDTKSFEQFLAEEEAEMKSSGDSATLNMSAVKEKADVFLQNNDNDIEAFKDYAEQDLSYTGLLSL